MERELIQATWGLVIATFLLVVATIIPLFRDLADRRDRRRLLGSQLVPDMNILSSRLKGGCDRLAGGPVLSQAEIAGQLEWADGDLTMINNIIDSGARPSLLFVNETYIVRHLLTQARMELRRAQEIINGQGADEVPARGAASRRARTLYRAALVSLDAAEETLPTAIRTINGETFWDRFHRLAAEREAAAAASVAHPPEA